MGDKEALPGPRWVAKPSAVSNGLWCVVDTWNDDGFVGGGFPSEAEAKAQADLLNAPDESVDNSFLDDSGHK